ncbi:porin [Sphingomonas sp. DBB INV C78]|uniref:carbohydrate porin n=1 Tax=Sphingomonas sp. DBB INV C78 TaxID=3349434 RepID=UPI0036D3367E
MHCGVIFGGVASLALVASPVSAETIEDEKDPFTVDLTYTTDLMGSVSGGINKNFYWLDNLDVVGNADLDALVGWQGATAHLHILNNLGGMPNNGAGTLQGVDNIEVGSQRLRIFEAWVEQRLGEAVSLRMGLYDLNSEFYVADTAGLLIAPAFGIGSEIAATGPNGPSIFPSTAIAARIDVKLGEAGYARAAILNATAGTIGDPSGVNLSFDDGALLIGEAGIQGRGRIGIGVWGYTLKQDDIRDVLPDGSPAQRKARGAYALGEMPLNDAKGVHATALFARAGLSDGETTPFKGGWQAGVLVSHLFAGRPDSSVSFGANQGYLSKGYRRNLADEGVRTASAETALEITFSDKLADWLRVQPDLQWVFNPSGDKDRHDVVIVGLRTELAF